MYYTSEIENYCKYKIAILETYDENLRINCFHYRKLKLIERKLIILNYIIENSGTPIKIYCLLSKIVAYNRTIQKINKVELCFINDIQSGDKIAYASESKIKTDKELTFDLLYDNAALYKFTD